MLSLKELALAIGAEYRGSDLPVPHFAIDSRNLQKGEIFVAIRAARDGHSFITDAIQKGAGAVVVDHAQDIPIPQIIVKDTLKAFGDLAHVWRQQFKIPVIGITGTCGKTTTKEMIATILREKGDVLAPAGTFNNAYGVPLTLLKLRPSHQFAVIEIGTNSPGEIDYLAKMVEPTVALITNIGASHLEKLKSFEGVSQEKSDIFTHLVEHGVAVLNIDEPFANSWREKIGNRYRVTYSIAQAADVFATNIHFTKEGANFDLHTPIGVQAIAVPLPGRHIVANAIGAASACLAVGISPETIAIGFTKMMEVVGRFKQYILKQGCTLIDDSYNASPGAVKNAIDTLKTLPGRKVFVMTNLGELGEHMDRYHQDLAGWLTASGFDKIYLYGKKELLAPVLAACHNAQYFEDKMELTKVLRSEIQANTTILIKGIHSLRMDSVVAELVKDEHA